MPYSQITLQQLRQRLAVRWESVPFWTVEEARLALNETLRRWNLLVGAWRTRTTVPTIANRWFYAMPGVGWHLLRVEWNQRPLTPGSIVELDLGQPGWQTQTIASGGSAPTQPTIWAPVGTRLFALWPSDTVATNAITVDILTAAPVLVRDGDYADVNLADLDTLLGMALRIAAFKEGGQRFLDLQPLETAFYQAAADQNAQFRASAFFRAYMGIDKQRRLQPMRATLPAAPEAAQ